MQAFRIRPVALPLVSSLVILLHTPVHAQATEQLSKTISGAITKALFGRKAASASETAASGTAAPSVQANEPKDGAVTNSATGDTMLAELRTYELNGVKLGMPLEEAKKRIQARHPGRPDGQTRWGIQITPFTVMRPADRVDVSVGFIATYGNIGWASAGPGLPRLKDQMITPIWEVYVLGHEGKVWAIYDKGSINRNDAGTNVLATDFQEAALKKYPALIKGWTSTSDGFTGAVRIEAQSEQTRWTNLCDGYGFTEVAGQVNIRLDPRCSGGMEVRALKWQEGSFTVLSTTTIKIVDGVEGRKFFEWLSKTGDAGVKARLAKPNL